MYWGRHPVSNIAVSGRPPADYGDDPTRESLRFDVPHEPPIEAATSDATGNRHHRSLRSGCLDKHARSNSVGVMPFAAASRRHNESKDSPRTGVNAMTRQLALEGARYGIRAVAISPGPFLTPAADRDLGDNQAARDAITRKTLLKRFGQPGEVAELAVFLASDRASYITGANYPVDGGATAW